jgi:hypothetical protein
MIGIIQHLYIKEIDLVAGMSHLMRTCHQSQEDGGGSFAAVVYMFLKG